MSHAGETRLDTIDLIAVCLVALSMGGLNGFPFPLCNGLVVLPAVFVMTANGLLRRGGRLGLARRAVAPTVLFGAWTALATVAAVANSSSEAFETLLWSYWTTFLLYLCCVSLKPSDRDLELILLCLATGFLLRFSAATLVFYQLYGIPSLSQIFDIHFQIAGMEPYRDVTFGSTGNTGALVGYTFSTFVVALMTRKTRWLSTIVLLLTVAVLGVNFFITGSRGAILVAAFAIAAGSIKLRSRWRYLIVLAIPVAYLLLAMSSGQSFSHRLVAAATLDSQGDGSVSERMDSIRYGWNLMLQHPFGVGPGMEHWFNPYSVAHQFAISQGSELGPAGLLCVSVLGAMVLWSAATSVPPPERRLSYAFVAGALAWIVYAMTTNTPMADGPNMPWAALLALFLAFGTAASTTTRRNVATERRQARRQSAAEPAGLAPSAGAGA